MIHIGIDSFRNNMEKKTACSGCDLLIELPNKVPFSTKLCCPRCHHTLTRGHKNALDYTLAISISCLFLLVFSLSFNFLSFESNGQFREIMLFETTLELYQKKFYFLALLVCLLTIVFPASYLLLLLTILVPVKFQTLFSRSQTTAAKHPIYIMRMLNRLAPWIMVDVFLIGVLVALIKMWSLATLSFGISFWSYVIFVLMFSYVLYCADQQKLFHWVRNDH